jgi:CAP-Gly domain
MAELTFQINDPVTVNIDAARGGTSLEGIVAYQGSVPELGDDTDESTHNTGVVVAAWIGVRLTGKSVGQGTNSGSIAAVNSGGGDDDGATPKVYFDCPSNCGVFVRPSQVSKRTLNRLEELRLRRELASSAATASTTATAGSSTAPAVTTASSTSTNTATTSSGGTSAASAAAAATTPPRSATPAGPRESPKVVVGSAATTLPAATAPTVSAATRLEEIRLRREALLAAKQHNESIGSPSPIATAPVSSVRVSSPSPRETSVPSTITSGDAVNEELKAQMTTLATQLKAKEEEARALLDRLAAMERENMEQAQRVTVLQEKLDKTLASPQPETPTKALLQKSVEEVHQENSRLQMAHDETKDRLDKATQQLSLLNNQLVAAQQSRDTALDEATQARSQVTVLQNQMQAASDQSELRSGADAAHYKERAKLTADLSALRRKVEQLEADKLELEATIEDVTLDKEQLQEEKESLEDKTEEMKLDLETAHMELEELRLELQDAQATAERVTGAANTLTVATVVASGEAESHSQDSTTEMVSALQVQNVRLREALIRLREQTTLEKMELTRQLRTVEKDAEANLAIQAQVEELSVAKQTYEEQINDLKDMVEQGAAFESMVEDLSDRVLALEEDNVALRTVVREMEEAIKM